MIDLTRNAKTTNSVSAQLEHVITNLSKYSLNELKTIFVQILENPNTSVSIEKKSRYLNNIRSINSLIRMQMFLSDIYLAGANMSVKK